MKTVYAMYKKLILFLLVLTAPSLVARAGGINNNEMKANWGNPASSHCQNSNMGDATIGTRKDSCKGGWSNSCVNGDDGGTLMLVARDVNANGARFCVTTVQGERKKKGNAWTLYFEPTQGQKCFWLCKPGYGGDGCSAASAGCDSTTIKREDFNSYSMSRTVATEAQTYMFHWDENDKCGRNSSDEHDMILGISGWTQSGHGAFAQPFMVRGTRDGWKNNNGYVNVWKTGEPTLLCKSGYTLNGAKNDCEAIDATQCGLNELCPSGGWTQADFKQGQHELKWSDANKCNEYRCTTAGHGFASATSKTCGDCGTAPKNGVHPTTGVCVKCENGQKFSNGNCVSTTQYSQSDIQFGKGKNRDAVKDLFEQCWTKVDVAEFKTCVTSAASIASSASAS